MATVMFSTANNAFAVAAAKDLALAGLSFRLHHDAADPRGPHHVTAYCDAGVEMVRTLARESGVVPHERPEPSGGSPS